MFPTSEDNEQVSLIRDKTNELFDLLDGLNSDDCIHIVYNIILALMQSIGIPKENKSNFLITMAFDLSRFIENHEESPEVLH